MSCSEDSRNTGTGKPNVRSNKSLKNIKFQFPAVYKHAAKNYIPLKSRKEGKKGKESWESFKKLKTQFIRKLISNAKMIYIFRQCLFTC
jgi:hypothetical protein